MIEKRNENDRLLKSIITEYQNKNGALCVVFVLIKYIVLKFS